MHVVFAAVHESGYGHIAADHILIGDGRSRGEADMPRPRAPHQSDAIDPTETLAANFAVTHNAAFLPTTMW
jgi:hypothetical protein